MTDEQITQLTKDYNEKRKSFDFPTVAASESGIRDILKIYPAWEKLEWDTLLVAIGTYISELAFD